MRRLCFFHAGCPDGFGAAWAVWRAWGDAADYLPRGHDDALDLDRIAGTHVVFVDVALPNALLDRTCGVAKRVTLLDHHVSARDRYEADPSLVQAVEARGHHVRFDLEHSGAVLAWNHFHPGASVPALLEYVEDMDLWNWKLPDSEAVNAAIVSYPRTFEAWNELLERPIAELVREGEPIARANRIDVDRAVSTAHPVRVGELRLEAVNERRLRSAIGHALSERARFGAPCGVVYRMLADRVDVSIYSIGPFDVAKIAAQYGGGGHRNASGFSVPLREWLERFV
ncbi:MAG: hypothetical protein JSU66_13400 [Deltaproteobacteria bacterium]|nr:MAG: hypothetical protein JSU66_13400 [Deltaproteobacteria bacterium]